MGLGCATCAILLVLISFKNDRFAEEIYIWSAGQADIDPYHFVSNDELGEYVLGGMQFEEKDEMYLVFYDDTIKENLKLVNGTVHVDREAHENHNLAKEYYWSFFNESGVLPSLIWQNATLSYVSTFETIEGNQISYHLSNKWNKGVFKTNLGVPPIDLIIEMPSYSGTYRTRRTFIELASWGFIRWKFNSAGLTRWEEIIKESSVLSNSRGNASNVPAPELFQVITNPCAPDMFAYYILTYDRALKGNSTERRHVYVNIPLHEHSKWIDMTSSFCRIFPGADDSECGTVQELLATNKHLLALTHKGLFVSESLSSSDSLGQIPYLEKPLLSYKLVNPCAELKDVVTCFEESDYQDGNSLPVEMKLHYNPVCHLHQHPNFRDTVILVIHHWGIGWYSRPGLKPREVPKSSVSILFADAPYDKWQVLLKSVTNFGNESLEAIHGIFYNHEQHNFDMVITSRNQTTGAIRSSRVILPRPRSPLNFYKKLSGVPESGYQPFAFDESFQFRGLQVSPGSMDVFFYGNQLWIAASAGVLVYQALGEVENGVPIDYCSFGHPDRFYVCVNERRNALLIGRIGRTHAPSDVLVRYTHSYRCELFTPSTLKHVSYHIPQPHLVPQIVKFAEEMRWIVPVNDSADANTKSVYQAINNARMIEQLRNSHFTISYGGNLLLWYLVEFELPDSSAKMLELLRRTSETLRGWEPEIEWTTIPDTDVLNIVRNYLYEANSFSSRQLILKSGRLKDIMPRLQVTTTEIQTSPEVRDGPLVAFPMDAISCLLFESTVEAQSHLIHPAYIDKVHVGKILHCLTYDRTGNSKRDCSLYIRHIKTLRGFLPGFESVILAYVVDSIPMQPFHCSAEIKILDGNNFVELNFVNSTLSTFPDCWQDDYVGQTFFIPGLFSVLLLRKNTTTGLVEGYSTRVASEKQELTAKAYGTFLIDLSSRTFKLNEKMRENPSFTPSNITRFKHSWEIQGSEGCNFNFALQPHPIIHGSGGRVSLDLHDTLTFRVRILALNEQGQVMMQRPLLYVTNSSPRILSLERDFERTRQSQSLEIVVKPTGLGIGISTVVIRSLACSSACQEPCSFTYVFQLQRREGRALKIHYPTKLPENNILKPGEDGYVRDEDGRIVYIKLPVNYRPPSIRGRDVPMSHYIYNADPSQRKYKDYYRISNETGVFGKCLHKPDRAACRCTDGDKLNDHPDVSDCKEVAYVVRRGQEFSIKASYTPLMNDSDQNKVYFVKRHQFSVTVKEINGRAEYTISSDEDEYLREINSDKELNFGRKFYDAGSINITCYGTGLFHFKAALGEFDSFGEVTGHFVVFSEDPGINAVTYMMVMFLTLTVCFLALFFAFLHLQKRLLHHLPLQGETEKIKTE